MFWPFDSLFVLSPPHVFIFCIGTLLFTVLVHNDKCTFYEDNETSRKVEGIYFKEVVGLLHCKLMQIGHLILFIKRFPKWPILENSTPFNYFTFLYNNPFFSWEVPLYTHSSLSPGRQVHISIANSLPSHKMDLGQI